MRRVAAMVLFSIVCPELRAFDALVLEVREITLGGVRVQDASVRLDLLAESTTRLTVAAGAATLPDPVGTLTSVALVCEAPVIAEPKFSCDTGRLRARGGPTGTLDMRLAASYDTESGTARVSGRGQRVAGTTLAFSGHLRPAGWDAGFETGQTTLAALREFVKPWFQLPADITGDGKARIHGAARGARTGTTLTGDLALEDVSLTNEASTIVTDQMRATAKLAVTLRERDTALRLTVGGLQGQVLVGPVLLDFGKNPLELDAQGAYRDQRLTLSNLSLRQKDLLQLTGAGEVNLTGETPLVNGDFKIGRLEFPAAYTSYMQITLAASLLGDLRTSGSLHGELSVRDNGVTALHVAPDSLELHDNKDRLQLSKMSGDIHWAPSGTEVPRSRLSWASGGAYGLTGGEAGIEFLVTGANFALTRPTKLPVLDGALAIDILAIGNLGADDMEVAFKGAVEPISMPRLATVFGWPQFQGTLAASIPGVTLKDNVLEFQGNVESQVFGGRIVGSNIRLQDPLGNFPQFFADVRARDLDLGLVTQTFEVGSITGRLDVDVLNLQLFNWTPVAFDARLATPPGDKSRHRISAKAVTTLSNAGGGGGGVVKALQSGVLRFFDDYSYEKLGITCKLRDDVCEMSGIEPAGVGYYIVKGSGLPRIDIIGNSGRVRWSQLVEQISTTEFSGATTE
jgi:hypothetical protein